MKFNYLFIFILLLTTISCQKKTSIADYIPQYKFIISFSEKINAKTGLNLYIYGINRCLSNEYQIKNGTANFSISYALCKNQNDFITVDEARSLIVFVTESLTKDINSNATIHPLLDFYPWESTMNCIHLYFQDDNKVELDKGIANVSLVRGKIRYERYEISEYSGKYPALGKHFLVHEENYADALEIVKSQGLLKEY